jgi:DNA modification methylase
LLEILAGEETSTEGNTDDDAVPDVPETPVSRLGDVWICGKHRVLCGDATQEASYQALLGTDHVSMLWQDPPYNVDYANSAKDKLRGKDRPILNDNLGDGFSDFLVAALTPALARCDGAVYIAMSSSELDVLQAAFRAAGGHWSTFIIWAKNTFTMGRADYQRQYEPMLYGWREGSKRHWCGDRDQGDVWQIKKPVKNDLHATMKPVELVERAIRNSSRPGDTVLDCFAGSGTTMIAAEKSGRQARLMELDPKYVDTIVRRWQDHSGKKATRESDGVAFGDVFARELGQFGDESIVVGFGRCGGRSGHGGLLGAGGGDNCIVALHPTEAKRFLKHGSTRLGRAQIPDAHDRRHGSNLRAVGHQAAAISSAISQCITNPVK